MYLQYYALAFFLFYLIDRKNRYTWSLLSALCLTLMCNIALFDIAENIRYTNRCWIILIFAILLMKEYTKTSGYQSFILLLFLASNLLMLYDKSLNNYFYANFEAIIYGLVSCQFLAIIPRAWCGFTSWLSVYFSDDKDKKMVGRV